MKKTGDELKTGIEMKMMKDGRWELGKSTVGSFFMGCTDAVNVNPRLDIHYRHLRPQPHVDHSQLIVQRQTIHKKSKKSCPRDGFKVYGNPRESSLSSSSSNMVTCLVRFALNPQQARGSHSFTAWMFECVATSCWTRSLLSCMFPADTEHRSKLGRTT